MSMTMLTIFQLIKIAAVYIIMTILVPALIFYRKISAEKLSVRFMIYSTIGNFYMINLVLILQLLHISNRYTLLGFTIVPILVALTFINKQSFQYILWKPYEVIHKLSVGLIGWRTFFRKLNQGVRKNIKMIRNYVWKQLHTHIFEWILLIGLVSALLWVYGTNSLYAYGYCLSDVPVHNYWINEMGNNNHIFVAGVYPFGFHCVIYYIHEVFSIDTYVLLRLFWLVQTIYIHLMLFAFIKACTKTKYAAYVGVYIYVLIPIFQTDCTSRYHSSLPQEFGMLFILPSIYFALAFFRERKMEVDQEWIVSKEKKRIQKKARKNDLKSLKCKERMLKRLQSVRLSTWYLVGFTLCFSMTLTVHFYDTMIAGLFCVAIALGFFVRFFNHRYFGRVVFAFFLSIFIAALPMAFAYATGTPLQASLNWGMKVINEGEDDTLPTQAVEQPTNQQPLDQTATSLPDTSQPPVIKTEDRIIILEDVVKAKLMKLYEETESIAKQAYTAIKNTSNDYLNVEKYTYFCFINLAGIGCLFLLGILSCLQRRFDYGALLCSSSLYLAFLFFLLGTGNMGLPQLMDSNRCSIFLAYSLPILWSLLIDAPIYILFGRLKRTGFMHFISFLCIGAISGYLYLNIPIRTPLVVDALESNQAVTCLTNIIRENKDYTWTIVSANDELNMAYDHGYHYETIDFLNKMEYTGSSGIVTIPTHTVYFFIEKKPIDYMLAYENSGQSISPKGANRELPKDGGIIVYQGENRWIIMSRMYYWALAYQKMYSNEMKVYYEDDSFICYKIKQNDYNLNNFAIDYGYNHSSATYNEKE